ncbi:MAG: [FeFe] hydrogenase H-cluster radical SAM maturase HydG [Myxococcota bacterium]|jgi:2-iminoacetate synthase|nr:[FeFe] hydrogenase H-cluster radical SAM maturase HydG [Myxococcota bacterium]
MPNTQEIQHIHEPDLFAQIEAGRKADAAAISDILAKARQLGGLDGREVACLLNISDPHLLHEMFDAARYVKETIYGKRLVLFAPMYVSNLCRNECSYCAFRARNKGLQRRALSQEEIAAETKVLVEQGHKRVLLVAGEAYPNQGFSYILDAIDTVYGVRSGKGEVRRVNVNVAPLTVDEFKALASKRIGTYQIFQETYHRETYARVHLAGHKTDFDWRLGAMDRAMQGGVADVGIGVLFGLFDWRFEILALLSHCFYLERRFGVGPHTISVPRLEPAVGSSLAEHPPHAVSDLDFRKIVAILRLAVPYTGIIMSTRESATIRRESFALGVSQISAGSRTNPGGYAQGRDEDASQFSLGDHRSLEDVIKDVASLGYIPSFCTGCYRLGRVGKDFMDLARPGDIRHHCDPNAVSTFAEYLLDYASDETHEAGFSAIEAMIGSMDEKAARISRALLAKVQNGSRDVYC